MGRAGQVSMEYLMVVAIAAMLIIPLIGIFFQASSDLDQSIQSSQADRVANEIVDAADEVYYLGPPAKKTLKVYLPDSVKSLTIGVNYLQIDVHGAVGAPRFSAGNLSGSIQPTGGLHVIAVYATTDGVLISENG
ncbi:MAG: hypothetical protein ABIH41_01015 [Nanoarchaeota archaeon]